MAIMAVGMNYELFNFSSVLSQKRLQLAQTLFVATIVSKILVCALYLLGVPKRQIGPYLEMKEGSHGTFLFRLNQP